MISISFVVGAFCSALAGFIGMTVATKANVRTTNAARTGLGEALNVAFSGGLVMGSRGGRAWRNLGLGRLVHRIRLRYDRLERPSKIIGVISGFSSGRLFDCTFAPCRWRYLHQSG